MSVRSMAIGKTMLRCTIELLPGGDESRARTLGLVEIANVGGTEQLGVYKVALKKTPPFRGALKAAWRKGDTRDSVVLTGNIAGHHRTKRGVYDLLYLALKSCGLEARNRTATVIQDDRGE